MAVIKHFKSADNQTVEARIAFLERDISQESLSFLARAEAAAGGLFRTSKQPPMVGGTTGILPNQVATPPVDLEKLSQLFRTEPTHAACVKAKAASIAGQGYRVRPASDLRLSGDVPVEADGEEDNPPDPKQRDRIVGFLESGMPEYSFQETLVQAMIDTEALGQGYIELSRNHRKDLDGLYPVKSVVVRILADNSGYVMERGSKEQLFGKYTPKGGQVARVRLTQVLADGDKRNPQNKVPCRFGKVLGWSQGPGLKADQWGKFLAQAKEEEEIEINTNEFLIFRKPTTKDTWYGESDIVSALYDVVGGQLAAMFNLDYFERNAVPRMVVIAQGGTLSDEVVGQIEAWIGNRNSWEVMNQMLLLSVPDENVEIKFQPIGLTNLSEAGFDKYRDAVDARIFRAHRTPRGMVGEDPDERAGFQFLSQVVRPAQRTIEAKFDYIFEREWGIKDWVLDLPVPDILGDRARAEIYDILLRRGVVSINEVRAYFGAKPIPGGDIPFVLVPGAGVVPMSAIEQIHEAIMGGYKPGDTMATSDMQTPPTGSPVYEPAEEERSRPPFVLFQGGQHLRDFSPEVQKEMACMLEQMALVDPQLVADILPESVTDLTKI